MRRVVLDTNVVVSGTILERGAPFLILEAWRRGRFLWVTSNDQRSELITTLRRPKLAQRYGLTKARIGAIARRIDRHALLIEPQLPTPVPVRDPDDEIILAIALAGQAEVLVTGDGDLLDLAEYPDLASLRIMTPAQFVTVLADW